MNRKAPLLVARAALVVLTLLVLWFIFSNSAQVASVSASRSNTVAQQISEILSPSGEVQLSDKLVRKSAHFTEYAALGICLAATMGAFFLTFRLWPAALLIGAFTAFCDETIQLFTSGRSCQLSDMLLDTCGVAFGIFCVFVGYKIFSALRRAFMN